MSTRPDLPAVVVQVAATSADAVDWAAAEASARGLPLRLQAVRTPPSVVPGTRRPDPATEALDAAMVRARAVDPGLAVETSLIAGSARRVLLQASRTAALLVLDARSPAAPGRLLPVRAPLRLASAAGCPVAVVRALPRAAEQRRVPRVVVGIDGTPSSGAAVGFAALAARRRGIPLRVVHAWTADPPADLEGVCACPLSTEADALRLVDRTLAPWRAGFPDVPMTAEVRWADAAAALVTASEGAALVVLGAPSRRRLAGTVGPVGRRVLAGVAGPVAIVGHEGRGTTASRHGVRSVSSR